MNTTQHLAQLLSMPTADFECYAESVNQLASLRKKIETVGAVVSQSAPILLPAQVQNGAAKPPHASIPKAKRLATRQPMRMAKQGTLRGDIHGILRSMRKPMRRVDIIDAVAKRRECEISKIFRTKVGDILTNQHDPFLRRVAFGTYIYVDAKESN